MKLLLCLSTVHFTAVQKLVLKLNFSCKIICTAMEENMSSRDKAAEFFRSILFLKSPKEPYLINRLIGHRNRAPADVYQVVVNCKDLTALFLAYPDIFEVNNTFVGLVESSPHIKRDTSAKGTCLYLASILKENSKFLPYPLQNLFDTWNHSPQKNKNTIKDLKEFKRFLMDNPNLFTVFKKYVVLTESVDIINSVASFCVSVVNSKLDKNCSYTLIMETSKDKPSFFELAVRDVSQLKDFMSCFSSTFKTNDKDVSLVGNLSVINKLTCTKTNSPSNNVKKTVFDKSESDNLNELSTVILPAENRAKLAHCDNLIIDYPEILNEPGNTLTKAAIYFSKVLWLSKPLNVMPIAELFKYKSIAPLDVQMVCGTNPKEFKEFLTQRVNFFIVTGENVLARKNIPKKDWAPPSKRFEDELCSVILNFFKSYTSHGKPLHLEKLFNDTGKCFVTNNGKKFFQSSIELAGFLEMFPECFYINNGQVLNIINLDKESFKEIIHKKSKSGAVVQASVKESESAEEIEQWKREILKRTELIQNLETCKMRAKSILENENVISLDCEGVDLGVKGSLCLLQIGTKSGEVYIFDVMTTPKMMNEGYLKEICESNKILKVIHDCRNDSANLFLQFQIVLSNIFDTRIAHGVIIGRNFINIGFNNLCQTYRAPINLMKDELKGIFKIEPGFWLKRPLSDSMLAYAALDVACLVPHVYNTMQKKLVGNLEEKILTLSELASKTRL